MLGPRRSRQIQPAVSPRIEPAPEPRDPPPIPAEAVHDPDFYLLPHLLPPDALVYDVGGNTGQSIQAIKTLLPHAIVHSFEPNPALSPALTEAARRWPAVTYHAIGLAETEGHIVFHVPTLDGVVYDAETTADLDSMAKPWIEQRWRDRGGAPVWVTFEAPVIPGDRIGLKPDFIKLDVEGFEFSVLKGLEGTLRACRPLLLVENSDWDRVTPYLASLGYRPMMPAADGTSLTPFRGTRTNTFYVHSSRGAEASRVR